jgi:hypothetical protein
MAHTDEQAAEFFAQREADYRASIERAERTALALERIADALEAYVEASEEEDR